MRLRLRRIGASLLFTALLLGMTVSMSGVPSASAMQSRSTSEDAPVYAYFYQWFNHSSWRRAKEDYPAVGRYSSDDPQVLRHQVNQARAAGLDGFLTSWKSTARLNHRLQMLLDVARPLHFDVGVVYEGLDFERRPLPIATVRWDMVELVNRWGDDLRSRHFGRPLIIWTGIDQYSIADIRSVRRALGDRAYLLASSKSAEAYRQIAGLVDGDAYYWSSANPGTSYTRERLAALASAVHQRNGIWLAPATAGFDGRTLGHHRVVPREGGQTLVRSLEDAFASRPDAVGVISWNEWSENTYIEPGGRYGGQELSVLTDFLHRNGVVASPRGLTDSGGNSSGTSAWTGLRAGTVLSVVTLLAVGGLLLRSRPRRRRG